ncbi:MAG: Mut7-C ubiquitin/RNAse domain-containing protein [Pseudomonadota bacterium]|nr:MAG: Mut7-C ubiquitin/RNAse domain-containing protein [Pseudomonadota bacterium]
MRYNSGHRGDKAAMEILLRLYEELNEHLAPEHRKVAFTHDSREGATVADVLRELGVPQGQVELVLRNGASVGFSQSLAVGDRVSIYPVFESLDVRDVIAERTHPLRCLRFVADTHLGKLARYLRMLGFDTLYRCDYDDAELATISREQHRVLLSRDRALVEERGLTHTWRVRATRPREQVAEVLQRFDLYAEAQPFTRCMECNAPIEPVTKNEVLARLQHDTVRVHERFWRCPRCERIYWQGSHYQRMDHLVRSLLRRESSENAE